MPKIPSSEKEGFWRLSTQHLIPGISFIAATQHSQPIYLNPKLDLNGRGFWFFMGSVSKVMIIPDPEELLVGEVVQFNPSAGCESTVDGFSFGCFFKVDW